MVGRLCSLESRSIGPELAVLRQTVARIEPRHFARPEDVEPRRDRARLIEGHNAEVRCIRLVVNLDVKRGTAFSTESTMAEAARLNGSHRALSCGDDPIAPADAGERHRGSAAREL